MDAKAAHVLGRYVLAAGVLVGAGPAVAEWVKPTRPAGEARYQATAPGAGNAFVIDTHTGQTWSRYVLPNQGFTNWEADRAVGDAGKK